MSAGEGVAFPSVAWGPVYSTPPAGPHRVIEDRDEPVVPVPEGEAWAALPQAPTPPTEAPSDAGLLLEPNALNTFTINLHDIGPSEVAPSERSTVHEPSVGNMGNTVFFTANWYAARSSDGGGTFTYVNPYTLFPATDNGFCCDQQVHYSRSQDMMLWALQYTNTTTTGTLRLARAVGSADVASNVWTYYDFTPQSFGFPTATWMDFPSMTVAKTFVYLTSNVYNTSDIFRGSVVWRISLTQLAAGGGISFQYFTRTDVGSLRLTEGAQATMYWAAFATTTTLRIHRWDDASGTIFWDDVALNPFTRLNRDGIATSPDGTNWALRADSRPLGGAVANGMLTFTWGAKQDGTYAYPYTVVANFSQSTRALVSQQNVWNPGFAWLYMTASVNPAGNYAGLINWGGGSSYPNSAVWVNDDISGGFVPLTNFLAAASTAGPTANKWGDYLAVHPHKVFANSWVGGTFYMTAGGGDADTVGRYLWFGRNRDLRSARFNVDFDIDRRADLSVFRPSNGFWYFINSLSGTSTGQQWGASTDILVPGDYDGDGKTDEAVWRPSDGRWYILRSSNGTNYNVQWGQNGDVPVPGDYDGDGITDIAVWRPSNGAWYVIRSSNGSNFSQQWGASSDKPEPADYDGDGKTDFAVWRPSDGNWYIINSSTALSVVVQWGALNDKPVPADYDGDGRADVAVWRPSNGTWYVVKSSDGLTQVRQWGASTDRPVPGDYDGDNKTDFAIWRPSDGNWYIVKSSTGLTQITNWGISTDLPIPNAFVR